jgi:hypothetical protein
MIYKNILALLLRKAGVTKLKSKGRDRYRPAFWPLRPL